MTAFARGDVLVLTNLTTLDKPRLPADDLPSALRVLQAEDMGDGWRLTVEPLTGEERTDG